MSMLSRSIPVAALALCVAAGNLHAQQPGNSNFQWYIGPHGGVMIFKTPTQNPTVIPLAGGHMMIKAKRTGLLVSVEEGIGDGETTFYTDVLSGPQLANFNDIRKYSAVLMAFPIRAPVAPFIGVGGGLIHIVNPQPQGGGDPQFAKEVGSGGFLTALGGVQFQLGPFMAFGQYQISSALGTRTTTRPFNDGTTTTVATAAFGEMLVGPTHNFSGGIRISLGGAREGYR